MAQRFQRRGDPRSPLLRIDGLTVRYGATNALDGLDLTVRQGELFVLLGGSGSGKTTLLRAIAGFVQPAAGRIVLDGIELGIAAAAPAAGQHDVPVLRAVPAPERRGQCRLRPAPAAPCRAPRSPRASPRCWRWSGWRASPRRRPHQLSGGQQQRVALARSLAPNPRLLLLDEPLSALDRNLRIETRAELARLQRRLGTSFILVTHDQEEALTLADRIGVMQDGRLAQVGTPAEVYERPNSRFVAEFLGAANILPAVAQRGRAAAAGPRTSRCARRPRSRPGRRCWRCARNGCVSARPRRRTG